ncbi:MAG: UvrD-helicase domain-containing protein [Blastocatellia bacterium]|nr:UvrD-helicase domain-containing protein [Blastocatellia bacterium]
MGSLKRARERARNCRAQINGKIGGYKEGLLERVSEYLADEHEIELVSANSDFLQNGHALLKPSEGCLYYNRKYDDDAVAKLRVILHELGHLELHGRLKQLCAEPDPVYGSVYAASGAAGGLTRYHPRAVEEAEANVFATEFLCPQDEAFLLWRNSTDLDSLRIARHFGVSVNTAQVQLAEALFWIAGGESCEPVKKRFTALAYNESQLAAATFTGAPTLVCAGPGTGKTATLVRRIEYLLREIAAEPESLLVLTFSNEAAQELEERIADRFGEHIAARLRINTFHGFGVGFLHHHGQLAGLDATILDEAGQAELVNSLLGKTECDKILNLKNPAETVRQIIEHIDYLKNRLHTPESLAAELDSFAPLAPLAEDDRSKQAARQFVQVFRLYEQEKAVRQLVDFADLIALPIRILANEKELVERYRKKYRFVLVDEYQDVSRTVAILLRHLCGPENPPWVVGDARQAIYRFLGAAAENVEDFTRDFPGGTRFDLNVNYRSCPEIVRIANQLSSLMKTTGGLSHQAHWETWRAAGSNPSSFGDDPVRVFVANSDRAEQEGIAGLVRDWILDQGVAAGDIAVLARRNIDVRNIVLALGRLGVKAVTAGMATPEGAAGDLACAASFADSPKTSLPRIAVALGRGRFSNSIINRVVRWISDAADKEGNFTIPESASGAEAELCVEIKRVWRGLLEHKRNGDAFTNMCAFLFDASDYLRRILNLEPGAERSLLLGEITTSLARAVRWRITHRELPRSTSRLGFGQHFRDSLNQGAPSPIPPPAVADAVRVMTCHAAKGLEFPFVAVVGQTLSAAPRGHRWLPRNLESAEEEDARQSDSLFFVGATRAQRALIVSYAVTAGGNMRSRDRKITPLLSRWHNESPAGASSFPQAVSEREQVEIEDLWGGSPKAPLAASSLDRERCSIKTYLNEFRGARFPLAQKPLYPIFFQTVRRSMEKLIYESVAEGKDRARAAEIFRAEWQANVVAEHQHEQIYFALGEKYVERFAEATRSLPPADEYLETVLGDDMAGLRLRLDLVASHRTKDGSVIAVQFRPESYADKSRDGSLQWSKLDNAYRIPFVLLRRHEPRLRPYVFSGEDGTLYPYLWSRKPESMEDEASRAEERYRLFSRRIFRQNINHWRCESCDVHLICPHWLDTAGK